jgi:hypothetical protein
MPHHLNLFQNALFGSREAEAGAGRELPAAIQTPGFPESGERTKEDMASFGRRPGKEPAPATALESKPVTTQLNVTCPEKFHFFVRIASNTQASLLPT